MAVAERVAERDVFRTGLRNLIAAAERISSQQY
jgi:phosphosulfolactate phosphohydrolase-like enzyme